MAEGCRLSLFRWARCAGGVTHPEMAAPQCAPQEHGWHACQCPARAHAPAPVVMFDGESEWHCTLILFDGEIWRVAASVG